MAKKLYININRVNKQIKKLYADIGYGTYKKIKKLYADINGYYKQIFGGGDLKYYGTITPLPERIDEMRSVAFGNYAIFYEGIQQPNGTSNSNYYAYDTKLTVSKVGRHYNQMRGIAGGTVGDYALFVGGVSGGAGETDYWNGIQVFDKNFTASYKSWSQYNSHKAGASVPNYAIFAGGWANGYNSDSVLIVDTTLTQLVKGLPNKARYKGASFNNYAVFINSNYSYTYDSTLTQRTLPTLNTRISMYCATVSLPTHLIMGDNTGVFATYDRNFTFTKLTNYPLGVHMVGTRLGDLALFVDEKGINTKWGRVYDDNLTQSALPPYSHSRLEMAFETVGDYALLVGGESQELGTVNTVDAYTIV